MQRLRIAALILATGALGALADTVPTGRDLVFKSASEFEWKPSTNLPPGAEYQLVREDPVTRGVQVIVRFPSGYSVAPHAHDADETLVVLKGKLWLKAEGKERTLGPADYAAIPSGVQHQLAVKGWGSCWALATTSGPYNVRK